MRQLRSFRRHRRSLRRSLVLAPIAIATLGLLGRPLPGQNIVSWWSGDGDANDHVGTNHGTLAGGATTAPGKFGNAFSLDGINDVVRINDSPTLSGITKEITITAWIMNTAAVTSTLIAKKQRNCRHFMLLFGNGVDMQFSYMTGNCGGAQHYYTATNVLKLNTWHHVAATYVSGVPSSMKLFVDGTEVPGTWTMGNGSGSLTGLASYVTIGADETAGGQKTRFFKGMIDEVELHHRAMSPIEVRLAALPRPAFRGDVSDVSLAAGGSQVLMLNAGAQHANKFGFVLGTLSGTTPGINLGAVNLPLNMDPYFDITLVFPNGVLLTNSLGVLDGTGKMTSRFTAIPLIPATLVGKPFHHACLVLGAAPFDYASNPVVVTLQK